MRGRNTNNQWVPFENVAKLSKSNPTATGLTEKIIKSLPTMQDVEDYLTYEYKKNGFIKL